jgi:hypothetical protein
MDLLRANRAAVASLVRAGILAQQRRYYAANREELNAKARRERRCG